jgi:hypothetical protein
MEEINAYKILGKKSEGKRKHGRLRQRWKNNVKMDFKEIRFEDVDWIHLAQDGVPLGDSYEFNSEALCFKKDSAH